MEYADYMEKKAKRHKIAVFFEVLLGVVIFLLVAFLLIYFLCPTKNVTVEGNTRNNEFMLAATILNDKYSENAVYVYVKNNLFPVKNIPFVESYRIKLKNRDSVEIDVREKELYGVIESEAGQYVYFDSNGTVVEVSDVLFDDVLSVSGISCEEAAVGDTLPIEESALKGVLTLAKNLKKKDIPLSALTFDENGDIWMLYNGIFINFGDTDNLPEKVTRISIILPKIEGQTGILHLEDYSTEHTDIIFEKK